jgi:HIT domain
MTSFIIKAQASRPPIPGFWRQDRDCAFCRIIYHAAHAHLIYEDDHVIVFLGKVSLLFKEKRPLHLLDILPLRPGHTLVVPKIHCSRVSELPPEYAASVGKAISRISNALTKGAIMLSPNLTLTLLIPVPAIDNTALNVVCNQEYAQIVPHVSPTSSTSTYAI